MRVAYYADDGTEFETEQECRKYETQLTSFLEQLQEGIHAYDEGGQTIDFDMDELEYGFEKIEYIKFDSQKAIDVFKPQAYNCGYEDVKSDAIPEDNKEEILETISSLYDLLWPYSN